MSHHASDPSEPWDYAWTAGLEAIILTIFALLKYETRFQKYLCEKIEEMKATCQKSKDDLEHELGVECICQDCWPILQIKGAVDNEFKNVECRETRVENKEVNRKVGKWGSGGINTVAGGATVSSKGLQTK
ncbi:hypothetical protein BHYA_0042g00050 [Botrytis hyacinthi]|uniref:Uncharacterized protein n=1 Tax=Botrytis hyacinthi TaxID=278943 RepID=A0A4Z1GT84_9HELO|nr:hypothetical protein BHYA_0042g00050 [Botrytis hyacinthi]